MITLVFLICMNTGQCIQNGPSAVFPDMATCKTTADMILDGVNAQVVRGEIPPHVSIYKCIDWGTPS